MATTRRKLPMSDTFRPRAAFALHDPGSNKAHLGCTGAETDSLDRLLSDATPAHPKWVFRVRPSMCGGRLKVMRRHCRECGTGGSPKPQADANPIEAGPLQQTMQCVKIGHGAGSSIKTGLRDTKGVCADDGATLPVRILSALPRRRDHLTAAPGDGDGWLRQARSPKSEQRLDQNADSDSEVLSLCSDSGFKHHLQARLP